MGAMNSTEIVWTATALPSREHPGGTLRVVLAQKPPLPRSGSQHRSARRAPKDLKLVCVTRDEKYFASRDGCEQG